MIQRIKNPLYRLLRWSEKYTKTDMVYLAEGGFWVFFGQAVSALSAFGLSVVFANFLSPETNGIYRYIISIAGLFSIATLAGMNTAVTRAVAHTGSNSALSGFKVRSRFGILALIASLTAAVYYLINDNSTLSAAFFIVAFFLPIFDSFSMYEALLQGKKDFKSSALSKGAVHLFAAISVAAAIIFSGNVLIVVAVYFFAWTLGRGVAFYCALRTYRPHVAVDKETLRYGKRLSILAAFSTVVSYIDRFIVFHFFGAAALAMYYFATAPVTQTRTLSEIISTLALPKLAMRSTREIDVVFSKRVLQLFGFGIVFSGAYITVAPLLFSIFFPVYQDAVLLSQLFSLTIAFSLPLAFLGPAFRSKPKRIKDIYVVDITSSVFLLVTLAIFATFFGVAGIIVARMATSLFGFLVSIFVWRQWKIF